MLGDLILLISELRSILVRRILRLLLLCIVPMLDVLLPLPLLREYNLILIALMNVVTVRISRI